MTIRIGDRVINRSYGTGTVEAIEHHHRGESGARVRFDCFIGTRHDRAFVTPLLGLRSVILVDAAREAARVVGGDPDAVHVVPGRESGR